VEAFVLLFYGLVEDEVNVKLNKFFPAGGKIIESLSKCKAKDILGLEKNQF
jgi:hypothetical protein